jgi:hypothetical protein
METKTINVDGELFKSVPETDICRGCAFHGDDVRDRCDTAIDIFDCTDHKIIWEKVEFKTSPMSKQIGGSHYQKKIQPWDIITEWKLDYWRGNVIKYVLRCNEKNGVEDLKKAIHYLEYAIDNYERDIR